MNCLELNMTPFSVEFTNFFTLKIVHLKKKRHLVIKATGFVLVEFKTFF